MFAFSEIGAAALRGTTWVDLFPWLDTYESSDAAHLEALVPNVPDWWIADSPRETAADTSLDELVAGLARLAVRRHRTATFGELAPGIDPSASLVALRLGPRAETVVRRLTDRDRVDGLLSATVGSLFDLRGTSPETVQDVATGVLGASILVDPEDGLPEDENTVDPVVTQLVDDLRVLARWRGLRGAQDAPLIRIDIEDETPEQVQEVAARISAITGRDFARTVESNPVDELENLIEQLDERETLALTAFVMATDPITIGELSVRLHVSKSRASGIVAKLRQDLASACEYETTAGGLLASMRGQIRPVTPLIRLLEMQPVLRTEVPSLGVPLWLALDRLDDGFEVTGPWAIAPDLRSATGRTIVMLEQFESGNGVVPVDDAAETLQLTPDETRQWLEYCGIPVLDDHVLLSTRRLVDHAAAVLEVVGGPVDIRTLVDLVDTDRSEQYVARRLSDDERFETTASGLWRLAGREIAAGGVGSVPRRPALLDVAGEPGAVDGVAGLDSIRPTRRLYRIGDTWCFRMRVTTEHLRGSGFTIPVGVAQAFGCNRGETRELRSPLGPQMIRWTGINPTCGTIRRFLVEEQVAPTDYVFLTYSAADGFGVVPCVATLEDPVRGALALVGVAQPDTVSDNEAVPLLASAIGMEASAKPRRILSRYQARDDAVATLLESAWTVAVR
ncbi:hypothetical protein O0V02_18750 [Gordonia amicalis]|uniref:hypothetical protein n=1 Tax=Gordonia amicalis TaxID=89053 RepID=UPI0022A71700|nr:hypothetical protein [Gordonia amicalis]MCZ0914432.1 hypothetical protein [Gordonia amicalis]